MNLNTISLPTKARPTKPNFLCCLAQDPLAFCSDQDKPNAGSKSTETETSTFMFVEFIVCFPKIKILRNTENSTLRNFQVYLEGTLCP